MKKIARNNFSNTHVCHALLLSLIYISISIILGMRWDSDDDAGIAYVLTMTNNNFSPFQWRLLSIILSFLFNNLPIVNWWSVNTAFALWLGAFSCCYVVFRRYTIYHAYPINIMLLLLMWICTSMQMNFTRTAAAASIGACLLLADSVLDKKQHPIEFCFGSFLLLYGASIRYQSAMICLGFLAVIGGTWLLAQKFHFKITWFIAYRKQIIGLLLAASIFFLGWGVNNLMLTPEQRTFLTYNSLRGEIEDYASLYPTFEEAKDVYSSVGFDSQALDLMINWLSEDTEVMTPHALARIGELRKVQTSYDQFIHNVISSKCHFLIMGIIICLLSFQRKSNLLRFIPPILFFVLCALTFTRIGRLPPRVFLSFLFAAVCSIVFLASEDTPVTTSPNICDCRKTKSKISVIALTFVYYISAIICLWNVTNYLSLQEFQIYHPWKQYTMAKKREKSLDIIHNDSQHLYFFDIDNRPVHMSDSYSFWEPRTIGYCENYFGLGGWDARHPHRIDVLAEHGIVNPVRALFELENTYCSYSYRLIQYLRTRYNERIAVSELFQINNVPIVKYTSPIDDMQLVSGNNTYANISEFYHVANREQSDIWYLSAQLNAPIEEDCIFYCNLTINNVRYTYRLSHDKDQVYGYIYGIDDDYDPSTANILIFKHINTGQYVRYTPTES